MNDARFRSFLAGLNRRDGESSESFADPFLSVDPKGAVPVTREQLRAVLPKRAAMFESIGASGTRLSGATVDRLDDLHALARTTWDVVFDDPRALPLELRSTYLLRRADDRWQVLVYLNHQDIARLVAERRSRVAEPGSD